MQRFYTGRLNGQCSGEPLPPVGEVEQGEAFVAEASLDVELSADREVGREGPVFIKGVDAGDVVAIHIEDVALSKWFDADPDYGMIPEIVDLQSAGEIEFDVPLRDGEMLLPGGIRVPFRPMIGSLSLAAREQCPNPWDHGGNMDVNEIREGATVYIRAQHPGGLLALGDLHAYQGDGEISGTGIEANGEATLTVSVSDRFPAPRPVVEVDGKVMTVGMGATYWEAVRSAVRDMTYLLMSVLGISLEEAYSTTVKGGSLRNGAIWMMSDHHLITMVRGESRCPRTVFLEIPFQPPA
ncbi:MAG: acetamidase/formamidase family protein [Planctomycetota bacterium]